MLTAIFQPEISQRELQLQQLQAQIQAQIAQTKERIKSLGRAERKATGAVSALQDAVAVLFTLAPESGSTLKSAVIRNLGLKPRPVLYGFLLIDFPVLNILR